jgi:hypothetical protein
MIVSAVSPFGASLAARVKPPDVVSAEALSDSALKTKAKLTRLPAFAQGLRRTRKAEHTFILFFIFHSV